LKPLVVIPARGGSKGVPRKNIKLLLGKPLIHYTIEAAQKIFTNDVICVTSEDQEIIDISNQTGINVTLKRPEHLASDSSGTYEVLLNAIDYSENAGYFPDTIILLQPTSPFRNSDQIEDALQLYTDQIDMVVSVKETKSNPYYILFEEDNNGFLIKSKKANFHRRQDCPKVWELNGAIYIINVSSLKKNKISDFEKIIKYEMDEISSHDIDTNFDWKIAEIIANDIEQNKN